MIVVSCQTGRDSRVVNDGALDHDTEQKDRHDGDERGQRRIDAEHRITEIDEIACQHEEFAMGEIEHLHGAPDQRQPAGEKRIHRSYDDAIDDLGDQKLVSMLQIPRYERRTDSSARNSAVLPDLTTAPFSRR